MFTFLLLKNLCKKERMKLNEKKRKGKKDDHKQQTKYKKL